VFLSFAQVWVTLSGVMSLLLKNALRLYLKSLCLTLPFSKVSVVIKNVPPETIVVGNPAKLLNKVEL
jgi:hypothetical protein